MTITVPTVVGAPFRVDTDGGCVTLEVPQFNRGRIVYMSRAEARGLMIALKAQIESHDGLESRQHGR